jgi:hypothetical protein
MTSAHEAFTVAYPGIPRRRGAERAVRTLRERAGPYLRRAPGFNDASEGPSMAGSTAATTAPHAEPAAVRGDLSLPDGVSFLMNEGQERVKDAYRGNYNCLAQLKHRYDPDNTFHLNQNIQPAQGETDHPSAGRRP